MTPGIVLVTGANGHVGNNVTEALLARGYRVRAMVRNATGAKMLAHLRCERLELVFGDLMDPSFLARAVYGVDGVFHLGAPNIVWAKDQERDIRVPIVEGTRNIILACQQAGTPKIIFASSCSAAGLRADPGQVFHEHDWNLQVHSPLLQAKIDAEQLAWRLCDSGTTRMISILLPAVIGPKFFRHTPNTMLYKKMVERRSIPLPRLGFHLIDARDAAQAMLLAFESKTLAGRCIVAGEYVTSMSLCTTLRGLDPTLRLPKSAVPNILVQCGVLLDWLRASLTRTPRELTFAIAKDLVDANQPVNTAKMRDELGLSPRPLRETLMDTLEWIRTHQAELKLDGRARHRSRLERPALLHKTHA